MAVTTTCTSLRIKAEPNHAQQTCYLFVPRHGGSAEFALPMVILDQMAEKEEKEQPYPCFH